MNDKILQKLLKIIGKQVVSENCCCINCTTFRYYSAEACSLVGGTFYEGSNCSEFVRKNCCKYDTDTSGERIML